MIGLIACSAQKLNRAAPARELYCSQLFQKSLAYAEHHCDTTYVVSALHGLVELDRVLEPYDKRIAGSKLRLKAWAEPIAAELVRRHGDDHYVLLAGYEYAFPLSQAIKRAVGRRDAFVAEPLAGMMIGDRLALLKAQIRRAA